MKYLKSFEFFQTKTGQALDYEVGDIVVCINDHQLHLQSQRPGHKYVALDNGVKYKVLKIYNNLEDKFLNIKYKRVDVENLETGKISKGWESTRFQTETEFDAGKYNI